MVTSNRILMALLSVAVGFSTFADAATYSQVWECKIDLGAGDGGAFVFKTRGDDSRAELEGTITTAAGITEVSGEIAGEVIRFSRRLADSPAQEFAGVILAAAEKSRRLGGRYSALYTGRWQADCVLESESGPAIRADLPALVIELDGDEHVAEEDIFVRARTVAGENLRRIVLVHNGEPIKRCVGNLCAMLVPDVSAGTHEFYAEGMASTGDLLRSNREVLTVGPGRSEPVRFISLTHSPTNPSERDRVAFEVSATHPDRVDLVEIYVDNVRKLSCRGDDSCSYTGGPFATGSHSWHAKAWTSSGESDQSLPQALDISATAGSCVIVGAAVGGADNLVDDFSAILRGPDDQGRDAGIQRILGREFRFANLRAGRYTVFIDSRTDLHGVPRQRNFSVDCSPNTVRRITVDFR